jgi:hypothetical protein
MQCETIWGHGGAAADKQCYEQFNSKGYAHGHCGFQKDGSHKKCEPEYEQIYSMLFNFMFAHLHLFTGMSYVDLYNVKMVNIDQMAMMCHIPKPLSLYEELNLSASKSIKIQIKLKIA